MVGNNIPCSLSRTRSSFPTSFNLQRWKSRLAAAVQFRKDALGHLKAISHTAKTQRLLDKAGVQPDEGVTNLGANFIKVAATRIWAHDSTVRMLA